jgi:hypothetical protein
VIDGMIDEYRQDMEAARNAYRSAKREYRDNPDILDKLKVLDSRLEKN